MPVMSFDLQDGKPPVTFSLKSEDCDRFMAFMDECQAIKEQRREWQGLTEAEKVNTAISCGCADVAWMDFADAIEAKLKEKNGRVDSFLRRLLDPEDLGHAVSHEVRQKVRELL